MAGWIKLHRQLLKKSIWKESTPEQKVILITLIMMANHEENEWEWQGKKYTAKPGQFVTSLKSIAENCGQGISMQNIRTALVRFEKYEFLTSQSTNRNRLITVVNWDIYQAKEDKANKQTNKQLTSSQQAANKQLTTNKNDKNDKNDKNEINKNIYTLEFEIFYSLYPNQFNKEQTFKNWKTCLKSDTIENIILATNNYLKYLSDNKTDKQYITRSTNFLGQKQEYKGYLEYKPKINDEKRRIPLAYQSLKEWSEEDD